MRQLVLLQCIKDLGYYVSTYEDIDPTADIWLHGNFVTTLIWNKKYQVWETRWGYKVAIKDFKYLGIFRKKM